MLAKDMNNFIEKYGHQMANIVETKVEPIFDPSKDKIQDLSYLESHRSKKQGIDFKFRERQAVAISAYCEAFKLRKRLKLVAEMGVGKTPISIAIMDKFMRMKGRPDYCALVMCPGHIVKKWERELKWMIKDIAVIKIRKFSDILRFKDIRHKHGRTFPVVAVGSKDIIKAGLNTSEPSCAKKYVEQFYTFKPGQHPTDPRLKLHSNEHTSEGRMNVYRGYEELAVCPDCFEPAVDKKGNYFLYDEYMASKRPVICENCGTSLSTYARGHRSNPHIDKYIHKHFKKLDFFIPDEVHELASADTMQGTTFGTLVASAHYTLTLTGTLIGGMARDIHAICWRMFPERMIERGMRLQTSDKRTSNPIKANETSFTEIYGVMERREVRTMFDSAHIAKRGKIGRKKQGGHQSSRPRPGISPNLYTHFLLGRAGFMRLDELGELPPFKRELISVTPDSDVRAEYGKIDGAYQGLIKQYMYNKKMSTLATMRIQVLDQFLDCPYGWGTIHCPEYDDDGNFIQHIEVCTPENKPVNYYGPKDYKTLELVKKEVSEGRKCCVFPIFVGKKNVRPKIEKILTENGFRVKQMPDNIAPNRREEWIERNKHKVDVLIVHPKRVMTGLDLIDFPTLIWYQVGYSTHVLRQASHRARRLIQENECRVFYLYHEGTIQEQAIQLMGEKESASQALEGKFDTEALKALMNGGENDDILSALANSLGEDIDAKSAWSDLKITVTQPNKTREVKPVEFIQPSLFDDEDWPSLEELGL